MSLSVTNAARQPLKANTCYQNTQKITRDTDPDSFSAWLKDEDKVCTDGKDDGKLSFGEALTSFGKGLAGIVKTAINHPIATAATVAAGAALTVATGGAALPVMVAAGAAAGGCKSVTVHIKLQLQRPTARLNKPLKLWVTVHLHLQLRHWVQNLR